MMNAKKRGDGGHDDGRKNGRIGDRDEERISFKMCSGSGMFPPCLHDSLAGSVRLGYSSNVMETINFRSPYFETRGE